MPLRVIKNSIETTERHFVENRHNSDESDNGVYCGHWMFHSLSLTGSITGPFRAWPDNASPALFCPATWCPPRPNQKKPPPPYPKMEETASNLVGAAGFEPTTPCPPDKCATGLRYAPSYLPRRWRVVLRRSGTIEALLAPINGPEPGKRCFKANYPPEDSCSSASPSKSAFKASRRRAMPDKIDLAVRSRPCS